MWRARWEQALNLIDGGGHTGDTLIDVEQVYLPYDSCADGSSNLVDFDKFLHRTCMIVLYVRLLYGSQVRQEL